MSGPKRLLTIGHSYVVAANRRLAHEMAVAGAGEWEVTVAAPERFPGDLRKIELESIDGEACRVVALPVRFARRPHLMRYGRALRDLLQGERWDVVHCWQEPYVFSAGQVARWTRDEAALIYATFQNISKRYPPPFAQIERRVMRCSDGWIAFGHTVAETLSERRGYRDRPHAIITPGVDLERFRPDAGGRRRVLGRLGWTDDGTPVVGFLGRFVEEKGIRVLLSALQGVIGDCRVLLVGGGPLEAELRSWAAQWEPSGSARVVTGVLHDEVADYLNAMDVLVAPSLTTRHWREQFGRMLIEAMACGLPIVGSDSGEIPHVVGDAGEIVPEGDWVALAGALTRLLADDEYRVELSQWGLQRAASEFALSQVARRHLAFFDEVIAARSRGDAEVRRR
jgi:glycosyltransferase involved in cell wall biosynthesis